MNMSVNVTDKNIAPAAVAACRAAPLSPASLLADPMAGFASPAGIASAAAKARGSMADTALLLSAFRRLADVRNDSELRLLSLNLELVFDNGGV